MDTRGRRRVSANSCMRPVAALRWFDARLAGRELDDAALAGCRRTAAGRDRRVTAQLRRVGLASELTSCGASTTDVMRAGSWKPPRMVAHYSTGATAERGAVARYL